MAFGFFDRIKDGLEKTRKSFVKNVESIVIGYAQILSLIHIDVYKRQV